MPGQGPAAHQEQGPGAHDKQWQQAMLLLWNICLLLLLPSLVRFCLLLCRGALACQGLPMDRPAQTSGQAARCRSGDDTVHLLALEQCYPMGQGTACYPMGQGTAPERANFGALIQ